MAYKSLKVDEYDELLRFLLLGKDKKKAQSFIDAHLRAANWFGHINTTWGGVQG